MAISKRIYTATEKSTGRKWDYVVKESWNNIYYSFNGPVLRFKRTRTEAKIAAKEAGDFQYRANTTAVA